MKGSVEAKRFLVDMYRCNRNFYFMRTMLVFVVLVLFGYAVLFCFILFILWFGVSLLSGSFGLLLGVVWALLACFLLPVMKKYIIVSKECGRLFEEGLAELFPGMRGGML